MIRLLCRIVLFEGDVVDGCEHQSVPLATVQEKKGGKTDAESIKRWLHLRFHSILGR